MKINKIIVFLFILIGLFLFSGCKNYNNIMSISVKISKDTFIVGDELDKDNFIVTYQKGKESIEVTDYSISGYDKNIIGIQKVTISYDELTSIVEIMVIANDLISFKIQSLPEKVVYYKDDELDLTGLIVIGEYLNGDIKEIVDYNISGYEKGVAGKQTILVEYLGFSESFNINYIGELDETYNYQKYTIYNLSKSSVEYEMINIKYGGSRGKDEMVYYDASNYVKCNIYGYEVSVNEYYQVIEIATNVKLVENGFVISAHGIRVDELKKINVGDFIYYNSYTNKINVYCDEVISKYNSLYMEYYKAVSYLNSLDILSDEYSEILVTINFAIKYCNMIYLSYDKTYYDEAFELFEQIEYDDEETEHIHEYSYTNLNFGSFMIPSFEKNYECVATWDGLIQIGGFRLSNSITYYDSSCYRDRNEYGFEILISKEDGIVYGMDVLLNYNENYYILSGHSAGADFLIKNVEAGDKIEFTSSEIKVYRDYKYSGIKDVVCKYQLAKGRIYDDYNALIPKDYKYIMELMNLVCINIRVALSSNIESFKDVTDFLTCLSETNKIIDKVYFLLIPNEIILDQGMWYYPFKTSLYQDDTSYDGVVNTLSTLKRMGINEIIIDVFYGHNTIYDSLYYYQYENILSYDYGEYDHDYLKCFITEAHKMGIVVNAFTQTFAENIDGLKEVHEEWYQIDYSGEKSKGSIYYYDICNDELQDMLVAWYTELVTKYDFDKVEYDIIRYSGSNLYTFENDVISDTSKIVDPGYTEYSMNKFMTEYNLTGDLKELIASSYVIRKQWLEFKETELINFITRATQAIKEVNPDIVITAAVLYEYDKAKNSYLQDFIKWYDLGIIDEVEVMCYTISNEIVNNTIKEYKNMKSDIKIRMGLSSMLSINKPLYDYLQIKTALDYNGYVMFASTLYLSNETFIQGMISYHHFEILNTLSSDEAKVELFVKECTDMVEGFYSKVTDYDFTIFLEGLQTYDPSMILKSMKTIPKNIRDSLYQLYLKIS